MQGDMRLWLLWARCWTRFFFAFVTYGHKRSHIHIQYITQMGCVGVNDADFPWLLDSCTFQEHLKHGRETDTRKVSLGTWMTLPKPRWEIKKVFCLTRDGHPMIWSFESQSLDSDSQRSRWRAPAGARDILGWDIFREQVWWAGRGI